MQDATTVYVGCDHAGFLLKEPLLAFLKEKKVRYVDLGTDSAASCDYPTFAHALAEEVLKNNANETRGILICGSGMGMAIAANRHKGIRAALCREALSAIMARKHNDANVLCLGARFTGIDLAKAIVDAFLNTDFEGGRHQRRVHAIEIP